MRTPALDTWRRELVRGDRTVTTFDALWRAACEEQAALECEENGLSSIAASHRHEARRLIAAARKGTAA